MLKKIKPTSLGQRTVLYVLAPTLVILLFSGFLTFQTARDILLQEWIEQANTSLKNGANIIDGRLEDPKRLLQLIQKAPVGPAGYATHEYLIDRLKGIKGVLAAEVDWPKFSDGPLPLPLTGAAVITTMHSGAATGVHTTRPSYTETFAQKKISLVSEYRDQNNESIGKIQVFISLADLLSDVTNSLWWREQSSFIIDKEGHTLAHLSQSELNRAKKIFEKKKWNRINKEKFGTIFSEGKPPKEVCVFYHLEQAPWTLVVIVSGEKVLKPLLNFRNAYFFITIITGLTILLTIHLVTSKVNRKINQVSAAASRLAAGYFSEPLSIETDDEIGALCQNFNEMTSQLKNGLDLQKSIELAREVQQNLLPGKDLKTAEVEISGTCIYCDATGGDYFDIIPCPLSDSIGVAVGDVVGHGISAALLMTTTRALVRCRLNSSGTLADVATEVNALLYKDTAQASNFVTLFLMKLSPEQRKISWVRAGHEPAIAYNARTRVFTNIQGNGVALGVNQAYRYQDQEITLSKDVQILLIGTDGIWDAENPEGEQFGKERVQSLLAANAHLQPREIICNISESIKVFQKDAPQSDDITFVIIKFPAI
ncbi:SpoIIE family protein phosphatase [Desulfotalea psychrophila]|nr:SpoIIE family protein phosphatase [Desulfotalea psychrophila]